MKRAMRKLISWIAGWVVLGVVLGIPLTFLWFACKDDQVFSRAYHEMMFVFAVVFASSIVLSFVLKKFLKLQTK